MKRMKKMNKEIPQSSEEEIFENVEYKYCNGKKYYQVPIRRLQETYLDVEAKNLTEAYKSATYLMYEDDDLWIEPEFDNCDVSYDICPQWEQNVKICINGKGTLEEHIK